MKKEFLLAIIVGLVMGLFITYGFYHSQKAADPSQVATITEFDDQELVTTLENGKLTIFSPDDEVIQSETSTKVAGSTAPNSYIVIFINDTPYITQADETGNFSRELELDPLANIISIHAIDESGEINTIQRSLVVYDQELSLQEQQAENDSVEDQDA